VLLAVIIVGGALLVWLALVEAPSFAGRAGFSAPLAWKLFFFHVPVAFTSFAAFALALLHSVQYLVRPNAASDQAAQSAVESGVLFSGLTLATGLVWGQAEWGVAWRWDDAKLVLVLLMFLIYIAYLLLRREIPDEDRRARVSAVYAVAAFVTIPLTWFAHRIWLSYHPTVFGPTDPDAGVVTPGVLPIFLLAVTVFLCVLAYFHRWRRALLRLQSQLEAERTAEAVP
jgi:heme exporter protein C